MVGSSIFISRTEIPIIISFEVDQIIDLLTQNLPLVSDISRFNLFQKFATHIESGPFPFAIDVQTLIEQEDSCDRIALIERVINDDKFARQHI